MCKYSMDPASIVEDTEQARFGLQTDGWKDEVKQVSSPSTLLAECIMTQLFQG